jgi:hypothetical protein
MKLSPFRERRRIAQHAITRFLAPDSIYLAVKHYARIGRWPRLRRPQTLNEYMQWLKLYGFTELHQICADKYRVRQYVSDKIGPNYLIPIIGVYEETAAINWEGLPEKFIIKLNHASGWNAIVRNKSTTNWKRLRSLLDVWLKANFYNKYRESQYKNIKPRIVVEELLTDEVGNLPDDIKVHCFGGCEPRKMLVQVTQSIDGIRHRSFYDKSWNKQNFGMKKIPGIPGDVPRPESLNEILSVARSLSADFAYVRVDMYEVRNKLYFGELTFTPSAGFYAFSPDSIDYELGRLVH